MGVFQLQHGGLDDRFGEDEVGDSCDGVLVLAACVEALPDGVFCFEAHQGCQDGFGAEQFAQDDRSFGMRVLLKLGRQVVKPLLEVLEVGGRFELGRLIEIILEAIGESVEGLAQYLVGQAGEPADGVTFLQFFSQLEYQPAFADARFAEDGCDPCMPLLEGFDSKAVNFSQFAVAPDHIACEGGFLLEVASQEDIGGNGAGNAFIGNIAFVFEGEMPVFAHLVVDQHLAPVGVGHEAGCEVDAVAHGGVLASLFAPDHACVGYAGGDADAVGQPAAGLQVEEFLSQGRDEFQGPGHVVFEGDGRAEKAYHDSTFVAEVYFLEIAGKVGDEVEEDRGKAVHGLVVFHAGEGAEDRDYAPELSLFIEFED